jgi:hypothetical protein
MLKKWTILFVFFFVCTIVSPGYANESSNDVVQFPSNYQELHSYLPFQSWVKVDSYDLDEVDKSTILTFVENSSELQGKKIQSAKIYPVSLPILLISHSLQWKAHYFQQIRVLCNFGKETQTIHVSGIRFQKSEYWVFSMYSATPCLQEIGSSDGFHSNVSFPSLYPSPSLYYAYFTKHLQSFNEKETTTIELQRGIPLLFSAQIWNPFFYSDLPFIKQEANTARFDDLVFASSSEELYNFIPANFDVEEIEREITENEKRKFVDHIQVMMKNSGFENPNHFDWDNVKIDVPVIIGLTDSENTTSEYFSDVALYVAKIDKPTIQNRYLFSALKEENAWLFHSTDQISSTEGWHYKVPRVYTFSGLSYNESTYLYYISMIDSLLLNRYSLNDSRKITKMWSLKRWNFSSM